ncbi:MAG: imidazoleglycerol-phosphate dehydratase HisB [Chloroflexi bacterium]|nr:imidazoleglycerol-phosphate dehydratase HisB [Chloroflexota bacterium]
MQERKANISRQSGETNVRVQLDLDGRGSASVATGVGMLDHLLTALGRHARFDLQVQASGDLHIDEHHTVEDVGITLGLALAAALRGGGGIARMAHALVPMDEALAMAAVDLSGRGVCVCEGSFAAPRLGDLGSDLLWHFVDSLARNAGLNVHIHVLRGENDHHKAEAVFKALGRALDAATRPDPRLEGDVASTKGQVEVQTG